MSVTAHRRRVALLGVAALALIPLATPALAFSPCGPSTPKGGLAQLPGGQPLADPIPHIPINGTAGFVVPGANTLPGGELSIGLGYLGQRSVCQQEEGIFDQNTLFLALGYGLTERLQLSFQVPYTWYEADKSDFNGSGVDDLSFGVGYRFLDEAPGWRPALSVIGYGVAPTAQRKEGLGTNEWSAGLALGASKTITGPLSAFASAGYQYNGRGAAQVEDQFVSGVGLAYAITPNVSVVAEGTANTNWRQTDDRHSDWIAGMDAGVRLRYGGFLVSLAGRKGFTNDAPDWGVFALVTYEMNVGSPFVAKAAAAAGAGAGGAGAAGAGTPGAGGPGAGGPGTGAPGAGGPGAGAGAPGAGAPGAGGPGTGAPGAGGPGAGAGAPGAGAPGAGGPGTGAPGAGAPGAGGPSAGAPGAGGGPGAPGAVAGIPPAALPPSMRSALRDVNFEFDQYSLTNDAKATLDELGQALKANPQFAVTIEGHADERGTVEYNIALAEQRAQAAKAYLVALGVDASRVDTISYGEQRPVDAGHDELAWAINRRAHFLVRVR
jgi:peptidoglycan-associated lipoprotein